MKFYVNSELIAILTNEEAVEHCIKCSYCYHNEDGSHSCILGVESWNLEEELANEDDNQLECWIS